MTLLYSAEWTLDFSHHPQVKGGPDEGDRYRKPHRHQDGGELPPRRAGTECAAADPGTGCQGDHGWQDTKYQDRSGGHLQELGQPDGDSNWRGQVSRGWASLLFLHDGGTLDSNWEAPIIDPLSLLAISSKLPYDVTPEQAMSHEEVRTRLEASIKTMKTITDKFLSAIIVSVDKIPYVPCWHCPIFRFRHHSTS